MDSVDTGSFDINTDDIDMRDDYPIDADGEHGEGSEAGINTDDVDVDLLGESFTKEEVLLGALVKSGLPLAFVGWFLGQNMSVQKEVSQQMLEVARSGTHDVNVKTVERFAQATDDTLDYARNLKVVRYVTFHTFEALHRWFYRQSDVSIVGTVVKDPKANGGVRFTMVYSRGGKHHLEFPLPCTPEDFARFAPRNNDTLREMFSDRPFKPQMRSLPENAHKLVAQLFLVGGFVTDPKSGWISYEAIGAPVYRPVWQDKVVPVPDAARTMLHRIWIKFTKQVDKKLYTEYADPIEYMLHALVKGSFNFNTTAPINLGGFKDVQKEFQDAMAHAPVGLSPQILRAEIDSTVKSVDTARGFRGTKPVLDAKTHAMFESQPLALLGDSVNHARTIGFVDRFMHEHDYAKIAVFAPQFSGLVANLLTYCVRNKKGYATDCYVGVMEDQVPIDLPCGESSRSPVSLQQDVGVEKADTDCLLWTKQNPTSVKKVTNNYFDANTSMFEDLSARLGKYKFTSLLMPVHLSYLHADHLFAKVVMKAKKMEILPQWSRSHNTELWIHLSDFGNSVDLERLTKFNYAMAIQARRVKVVNFMRDYLISGGHVHDKLGYSMTNEVLDSALVSYCVNKTVTRSVSGAASVWTQPRVERDQLSIEEVNSMFPSLGVSGTAPRPKSGPQAPKKRTKPDDRTSSGGSEPENRNKDTPIGKEARWKAASRSGGSEDEQSGSELVDKRPGRKSVPKDKPATPSSGAKSGESVSKKPASDGKPARDALPRQAKKVRAK